MNKLTLIKESDSIGDSLNVMNYNYEVLDTLVSNIQFSAINYWVPMANYYENRKDFWKIAARDVAKNFVNWQTASTLFEVNSSKWITPLIVWYPNLIDVNLYKTKQPTATQMLKNWLVQNYPVLNTKGIPNYVENQIVIVYSFMYGQETPTSQTHILTDSTTCVTTDSKACAYCWKRYDKGGVVDCDNGDFYCSGTAEDNTCVDVPCFFTVDFPAGSTSQSKSKVTQINASLTVDYKNKYEDTTIIAQIFTVDGCEWVYNSTLTT